MENKYPVEFIRGTLIGTLESMLPSGQHGYPYELFILISIGIEYLGACEDSFPWHKKRCSESRFHAGLRLLGPIYEKENEILYKKLRCGMAHVFAPVIGLGLGENRHSTENLHTFTYGDNEKGLDLNVDILFSDFKKACKLVINKIDERGYVEGSKVYEPFLSVPISKNG